MLFWWWYFSFKVLILVKLLCGCFLQFYTEIVKKTTQFFQWKLLNHCFTLSLVSTFLNSKTRSTITKWCLCSEGVKTNINPRDKERKHCWTIEINIWTLDLTKEQFMSTVTWIEPLILLIDTAPLWSLEVDLMFLFRVQWHHYSW